MGIFDGVDLFDGTGSFGLGLGGFDVSDFLGITGDSGFGSKLYDNVGTSEIGKGQVWGQDASSGNFGAFDIGSDSLMPGSVTDAIGLDGTFYDGTGLGGVAGLTSLSPNMSSAASNGGTKNSATSGSNAMDWVSAAGKAYELYN